MPMFSRRRGSSANPPIDRGTSAAASVAASSAFLGRAQSQTGLSSAAAAAALRSHTTSPEPVGSIQTKRMVRRGSQSSVGSGSVIGSSARGGVGRGGLQRNHSSGSMTERTFRSPSPGRSSAVPAAPEAPPVPTIPASARGHYRSASTEPPQRIMSPTPRGNNRGMSVDRAGSMAASSSRRNTTLADVDEVERQGSTGSINYSRPMSVQGHSPISPPKSKGSGGSWFTSPAGSLGDKPTVRPATADGYRSRQDTSNLQSDIASAANKPTKKKQIANNTQGSHLARAHEQEQPSDPIMVYDPASRTFIAKARPAEQDRQPLPAAVPKPAGPVAKPGEYDPNTRKIVPELPPQQPSIVVTGGDNLTKRTRPNLAAVDTQLEPPPKNPARADPNASPISPRAAGVLQKQPSIVREDPEGEQEAETSGNVRPYKRQTNGFSKTTMRHASLATTPMNARPRSESLDVPRSGSDSSGRTRGNSHSPSRSAHFSDSPIMALTRHDPPKRGISPAKSAMKHSPSSSVRGNSPMALASSPVRKAMSETSDTPSVDSATKKKKSVRVSFTDQPASIEPPVTPVSHAVSARKVSPLIDDDMDEIMKPRPDLPSFGSVRQSRMQQEIAEKVTERPPDRREASSDHAIGGILAQNSTEGQTSNDPVPPEVTSKSGPSYSSDESEDESTPATELDAADASAKAAFSQVVEPISTTSVPISKDTKEHEPDIQISLQPPTPGEEEKNFAEAAEAARAESPPPRSSLERFAVPGGWTAEPDEEDVPVSAPATAAAVVVDKEPKKVDTVPDSSRFAPTAQPEFTPAYAPVEPQLSDIAESDSDDSAIFSDAEEDLSYMDESGFASMDAIVESPAVQPKKDAAPESPSVRQAARRTSKEEARGPAQDWSQATTYWSQLSKQQREQIERSHLSSDDEYRPPAKSLANKPKKKKSAMKQPASAPPVQYAVSNEPPRQSPAQPVKSAMRKSMRGPPEPAPAPTNTVQMRSSLREGGGGMRTSMRDRPQSEYSASRPATKQGTRPASSGSAMPTAAAGGAMSQRPQSPQSPEILSQDGPFPKLAPGQQQPSASVALAKKMAPPPAPADDSDSESSFRKKRRPSQSNADSSGRYSMKRSMRAGSVDSHQQRPDFQAPPPAAKGRKAFSVRSLSPTGSFFGRKQLKESMRAAPADTGAKTLRGPNSMRTAKTKPQPAPRQTASTSNLASKFKSRFADSDDEDERGGQKSSFFRSRFADSDDDEPRSRAVIPADLTPVRGIPKRRGQDDGDSTDLSDESDDDQRKASRGRTKQTKPIVPDSADVEKAMAAARRNLGMTNGSAAPGTPPVNEGGALSKGSLRKPAPERPQSPMADSPKKRGFMGSILRRSRTHSNASQQLPMASPPPPLPTEATPASPKPGKLQRRTSAATQERDYFNNTNPKSTPAAGDANWPLSPPGHLGEIRPNTSDGVNRHEQAVRLARTMRPDIGRSHSNAEGIVPGSTHVGFAEGVKDTDGKNSAYSSKTGKKKKFGMLRKAFGLND